MFLSVLYCIACHGVMGLEPSIENKNKMINER